MSDIDEETTSVGMGPIQLDVSMAREHGWSEEQIRRTWNTLQLISEGEGTLARKSKQRLFRWDEALKGWADRWAGSQAPSRRDQTETGAESPQTLNPRFVEHLLGYPLGWTDCEDSAIHWFQLWERAHSSLLRVVEAC